MGSPVTDAITALTAPRMWRVAVMSDSSNITWRRPRAAPEGSGSHMANTMARRARSASASSPSTATPRPARLVHAVRGQRAGLDLDGVQVGGGDGRVLDGCPHTLRRDARVDRGAELLGKQVARVGGADGEALLAARRVAVGLAREDGGV